jgi:hypothetical protein
MNTFGDRIVEPKTLGKSNLYPMSSQFLPSELYITPQCGEHRKTSNILLINFLQKLTEAILDYE